MGFRSFIIDDGWTMVKGGDWGTEYEHFPGL